jgi:hypothetical protein
MRALTFISDLYILFLLMLSEMYVTNAHFETQKACAHIVHIDQNTN